MTTKFDPGSTAFIPVRVIEIHIREDGSARYVCNVIGYSKMTNLVMDEEDLVKTPEDLENYIKVEGGENE